MSLTAREVIKLLRKDGWECKQLVVATINYLKKENDLWLSHIMARKYWVMA